jgi:hypothetical protein
MFGGAIKFEDSQMKYAISQNCSFVSERRGNCPVLPKNVILTPYSTDQNCSYPFQHPQAGKISEKKIPPTLLLI